MGEPEFEQLSPFSVDSSPGVAAWCQAWSLLFDVLAAETLSLFGPPAVGGASTALAGEGETAADVELQLVGRAGRPRRERAGLVASGRGWGGRASTGAPGAV